ncbi:uncharacterized protein LOC114440617 isoform X2 [Parambassis ranga]|uniref:Uncharacterized protein LOC114440617 isoform X2 n=1 Tax=Parambassis ranga TaxID=210632 RepID=A0A6P7ITZ4_9TELE|nr:uncharacterized protein LOC114440617 isoform X2 [Parambassis ranga]
MMLTPAHKRMVAVAGVIGLVAITIILLWERYETLSAKEKRAIDFVPVHPCSEKYQQPDFNPEVVLCYNSVAVSQTIVIPSSAFQTAVHRSQPKDYFGHTFYLDCTPYGQDTTFNNTEGKLVVAGGQPRTKTIIIKEEDGETDEWFKITTGISGFENNWLLMAEQAAQATQADCVVCLSARPLLQVVPSALNLTCLVNVMSYTTPSAKCSFWDKIHPLTPPERKKPKFSNKVAAGNFTCVNRTGTGKRLGRLNDTQCYAVETVGEHFKPKSRSDIWWWCGDDRLFDVLPAKTTGLCASVTLILPVSLVPLSATDLVENVKSVMPHHWIHTAKRRSTRSWQGDDPTYIDSIGVPRGVPDEYKLVNQVSAGFESVLCWWCTINKNVDRINYIHFNVQKLGNKTEEGFSAIHEQLSATSLMAFQNRIAVDMLLAEKGGVCSIFGDQCCTFIPNNTAADGSLTRALEGLKSLNSKMKDHSGVDTSLWNGFGDMFGKYKQLVMSIIMSIAVFAAILTLCGCCCIPCIRALCTRMITTAIAPVRAEMREVYALLPFVVETPQENEDDDDEDMAVFLPD